MTCGRMLVIMSQQMVISSITASLVCLSAVGMDYCLFHWMKVERTQVCSWSLPFCLVVLVLHVLVCDCDTPHPVEHAEITEL